MEKRREHVQIKGPDGKDGGETHTRGRSRPRLHIQTRREFVSNTGLQVQLVYKTPFMGLEPTLFISHSNTKLTPGL